MIHLCVNGVEQDLDADPKTPLLWILRDHLGLSGTKYGCGIARCGACTILIDGVAVRACVTPASAAAGKHVTSVEGLTKDEEPHPLQTVWAEEKIPPCGYCESGQLMSAVALLKVSPAPTDEEIDAALLGHLCRCSSYPRIKRAIQRAAAVVNV